MLQSKIFSQFHQPAPGFPVVLKAAGVGLLQGFLKTEGLPQGIALKADLL